jgi:hypothetical protein
MRNLTSYLIFVLTAVGLGGGQKCLADTPPAGSYQQSCRNINANGGTLTAQCRTRSGGWPNTSLANYHQCIGDIQNQDGQLRCNRGASPPGGSYTGSCRDIWLDNQTLLANCQTRGGAWVSSALDVSQCRGDIQNQDGQLRCNQGGDPPKGSYRSSCRDIRVDGNILHASCSNGSGIWIPGVIVGFGACQGDIFNTNGTLLCNKAPLPAGSYQQSCAEMWIDADTLHARCKTSGGGVLTAQLAQVSRCFPGSIENQGGALACTYGNRTPPSGSYRQSCANLTMIDNTLSANCRTTSNAASSSSLDVRGCTGDISNVDGFLTCPKGNGPAPAGSYQKSCRDIVIAGTVLKALCETPQGGWLPTTLTNYQNCRGQIENHLGTLRCTSGPIPGPTPDPGGYLKLDVNNCNADVDAAGKHRSVSVYLVDLNLPSGGFFLATRMNAQYNEAGSCPFDDNGQPADADTIDLIGHNGWVNGHTFKVFIVDPLMQACEGQDNPTIDNCVRNSFLIKSNKNGDTFKFVVQ